MKYGALISIVIFVKTSYFTINIFFFILRLKRYKKNCKVTFNIEYFIGMTDHTIEVYKEFFFLISCLCDIVGGFYFARHRHNRNIVPSDFHCQF